MGEEQLIEDSTLDISSIGIDNIKDVDKAAILFVTLESAEPGITTEIIKNMKDSSVKKLLKAISNIGKIEDDVVQRVFDEFYELAIDQKIFFGGKNMTAKLLKDSFGIEEQDQFFTEKTSSFGFLEKVPDEELATYFKTENLQMLSLVLSFVSDEKSARLLSQLSPEKLPIVTAGFLNMQEPGVHFMWKIQQFLEEKFVDQPDTGMDAEENLYKFARIVEQVKPAVRNVIFKDMETSDPDMLTKIKGLIFTFPDIEVMDEKDIQTLLYEIDPLRNLAMALNTASDALMKIVQDNLSDRVKLMLDEEIVDVKQSASQEAVDEAQNSVVEIARRLESEEKIGKLISKEAKQKADKASGGGGGDAKPEGGGDAPAADAEKPADDAGG